MLVTFISQCEKKALPRTRRVLDAFADRIGERTWQTVITEYGLIAVKKLLRKTATKNTAVACHWARSRSRTDLVWIIGRRAAFNAEGIVPVNSTKRDYQHSEWEGGWSNTEVIALAAGIAGLFHDFGKANDLFQDKINPDIKTKRSEPYRHEWVSLRLFQSFVGEKSDQAWLDKLGAVTLQDEEDLVTRLIKDHEHTAYNDPFENLPSFAYLVAWLIVSHHRLPVYPAPRDHEPRFKDIDKWFTMFDTSWNSTNHKNADWSDLDKAKNWTFSHGTPLRSQTWNTKAQHLSKRALNCINLSSVERLNQPFIMHQSRLVLMLADHYYSAQNTTPSWQDGSYHAYANTDKNKQLKQKLDEHNLAVAHHAFVFARQLPRFRTQLPDLGVNQKLAKGLEGSSSAFAWQDKAFVLAKKLQAKANEQGFFGINMASTGKGKTIANARIMYGLADEEVGCRFSVAMGLRTLTLQTGKALTDYRVLDKEEIATMIGSQAVQKLFEGSSSNNQVESEFVIRGSESLEDYDDFDVIYDQSGYDGLLKTWFDGRPKIQKMLHAPVLVSTIDHLTPATEGVRGGKQIAPMLRLLTSDLILDEPDEFGLDDLPALARLVNWAGMLGAKVLLSTATMPPALAYTLFSAYHAGRKVFDTASHPHQVNQPIVCAWFDEFSSTAFEAIDSKLFKENHDLFVTKRLAHLDGEALILRKAKLTDVFQVEGQTQIQNLADTIQDSLITLHDDHHQQHITGKNVSIGVVRMANIKPLVAVAQALFSKVVPNNYTLHFCVYHSQFTLAQRSLIESKLDAVLNRKNDQALFDFPEINKVIQQYKEKNHIFVVLATSVAEVGRDHDYDWAIAEPSSMRSLVQLAGRIQRHRKQTPNTENFYILSKNYRALTGKSPAYTRPGYESKERPLTSHDLNQILELKQYQQPNAKPCIQAPAILPKPPYSNLVAMEHVVFCQKLLGLFDEPNHARLWWSTQNTWCAELQQRQPFRKSSSDNAYCLYMDDETEPEWHIKNEEIYPVKYTKVSDIQRINFESEAGNHFWFDMSTGLRYEELAEQYQMSLKAVSHCFGEVRIQTYDKNADVRRSYHPILGIFEKLESEVITNGK
jgi:CRISPR-associated endonuclease/helicase Cas3